MSGGAAVLAAIGAIAELGLRSGWSACRASENAIGGVARRPGDVLHALDGTTIEMVNTDAEGRLVRARCLADAPREGAERLVDVATLTCGAVTALGLTYAALFVNNEDWAVQLQAAPEQSGERVWRLPLHQEYTERMRSRIATSSAPRRSGRESRHRKAGVSAGGRNRPACRQGMQRGARFSRANSSRRRP
jgi:leucyl aminopeptidase